MKCNAILNFRLCVTFKLCVFFRLCVPKQIGTAAVGAVGKRRAARSGRADACRIGPEKTAGLSRRWRRENQSRAPSVASREEGSGAAPEAF